MFVGIEGLTPAFHDEMVGPEAYVPADARWLFVDPDAARRTLDDLWNDAEQRYEARDTKMLAFPPDRHYVTDLAALSSPRRVELPTLEVHGESDAEKLRVDVDPLSVLRQELDHARTFGDTEHVTPLLAALKKWDGLGMRVAIASDSQSRTDRLLGVLAARGVDVRVAAPGERPTAEPGVMLIAGTPANSFASPKDGVALVTTSDIFGERVHHGGQKKKRAKDALLGGVSDWSQLAPGDYLVHQKHGVGRYHGLKKIAVGTVSILQTTAVGAPTPKAQEIDALHLEYDGGTLYLPVYRLGEVQRYVGAEGHQPRIDKLGGVTWEATQSKVKRHVRVLAEELLQIYAQRQSLPGHRFPPADDSFRELEATFPFDETPDQQEAIDAVLGDMEQPRAMDRLVCGDVGYGKTEVAMRAAFKAVEHGRQVAVLVPTTLLAHQHYDNFAERFAPFPARVALLSRFQSPKESKAILKDVAAGIVDVIIGTHRLLQKDVAFRDLGLVIIDEEQWFGVKHKERLKQLRTQVDVLTLTATPIPRTLQMAMSSVRDLSIIDTPPAGRLAIKTDVVRASDKTVRDAILRELGRGGQIYFVHNRVETMERIGAWLHQLVPEARMVMAHGQMDGKLLEAVMLKFVKHEADVLIASAIIQSGLDVPNANTIIVNRADMFGLAQLYQLRGRVGRGGGQAYAYFLIPDEGALTGDAQKRLIAIQQFTELGSGFRIAAADMEIRGAGNLLGKQQSGHIAAIGLDLYMQMVEEAVQRLKGHLVEEEPEPTLQLPVSAFIPEQFVVDPHQRLSLYKRLTACRQIGELALLHGEIQDRYGLPPEPVERLLEVMQLRIQAKRLKLTSIDVHHRSVTVTARPQAALAEASVHRMMDRLKKRLRFVSPLSFEIQMPHEDWSSIFSELNTTLQSLSLCDTNTVAP